ncbi:MAG: hypothetical protein K8F91_01780 [Candidatus Obscuribacterales bacterium]|nr:hypothetical protein [Candidatus Obscuribacterales bacterium]
MSLLVFWYIFCALLIGGFLLFYRLTNLQDNRSSSFPDWTTEVGYSDGPVRARRKDNISPHIPTPSLKM